MTRVLVADDHPLIISGLEALLAGTSFKVAATVQDGAGVLDAVEKVAPDILLLDISMPGRNGIDVFAALRERGAACRTILLTAAISDEGLMRALELGVEGVVLKEDAASNLVRAMEKVRNGGRAIDPGLLQRAVDMSVRGGGRTGFMSLSPREQMVARRVAEGQRNREIADALEITEGTVKIHLHRIYEKLGVGNRTELAILARKTMPA